MLLEMVVLRLGGEAEAPVHPEGRILFQGLCLQARGVGGGMLLFSSREGPLVQEQQGAPHASTEPARPGVSTEPRAFPIKASALLQELPKPGGPAFSEILLLSVT